MSKPYTLCLAVIAATFIAWAGNGAAVAAPRYNITPLSPLAGTIESRAFGLNDVGQVVGDSRLDRSGHIGQARPVVWDYAGVPTELWSDPVIGGTATDINNHGVIVGRYGSGSGIPLPTPGVPLGRGFLWDASTGRIDLGIGPFGSSMAVAINDLGQVVGTSEVLEIDTTGGTPTATLVGIHPFLYDSSNGIRDLGTLGGAAAFAEDINQWGQVVGTSELASGFTRAFIWDEAEGMRELPTLGQSSVAVAINDLGQVLGFDFGFGAVVWDLNTGARHAVPFGLHLNNRSQLLGGTSLFDETFGSQMLSDLIPSNSGWTITLATDINETSAIVGYGDFGAERNGFLLTPVPEPHALLLLGVAVTGLAGLRAICRLGKSKP